MSAFIAMTAIAQHHITQTSNKSIDYIVGDTAASDSDAYKILLDNIPVDPEYTAPHFAIIDKDKRFYMSLGATVKAIGTYDWSNPYENPTDFKTSDFTKASPGNESLTQMTIKSSGVNFNIVGMPSNKYRTGIFVAITFNGGIGNEYITKCDYAYIKIAGFTLGHTSSLYDDKAVNAYLIDGNGAGASGAHSNMSFSYQRYFDRHWRAGIAIESPRLSMTYADNDYHQIHQNVPDLPVYLQYELSPFTHIRLSSVIRTLSYYNLVSQKRTSVTGYGAKLTSSIKTGNVITYIMAQAGEGIANYLKDNDGFGLDLVPGDISTGKYSRTKSWGCLCALQYDITPTIATTAMWGYMRNYVNRYDGGLTSYGDHLKYDQYAAANVIWRASQFVNIGVEYNYGIKHTFDNASIHNNRLSAMVRVGF